MQVGVLSVKKLFRDEVHYVVPLYQRPYVWNDTEQWRPLWEDLAPLAESVAEKRPRRAHFMGASVQERLDVPSGAMEERRIIDGQQRMTTLQLLLKAFCDIARATGVEKYATQLRKLCMNDDELISERQKRLKLWPTRSDQRDYECVMDAASPEDLLQMLGQPASKYPLKNHNIANAYLFFHRVVGEWLASGEGPTEKRIGGLYGAMLDQLRIVVIDLDDKDDAQAIFETLNARGAPLLSADLVKNSILAELDPAEAEDAYRRYWQDFDRDGVFWRALIGRGHAQRARIETFLQHTLTLLTGEVVSAGHLYNAYRDHAASPNAGTPQARLARFRSLGDIYKRLHLPLGSRRLDDFFYRLAVLDVVTAWPFILALHERSAAEPQTIERVLVDLESWLVRRMVCRLSTRGYGTVFASLTDALIKGEGDPVEIVRKTLLAGNAEVDRWPSDDEFENAWMTFPLYQNLSRPRVRFLLEAMEEALRSEFAEERAAPRGLTIEHVMPQGWRENWPLAEGMTEHNRDGIVQTLGNLTLLNGKFNTYQSNRPWIDKKTPETGKRANLNAHAVLHLNRQLCGRDEWNEAGIEERGRQMSALAKRVWPFPAIEGIRGDRKVVEAVS